MPSSTRLQNHIRAVGDASPYTLTPTLFPRRERPACRSAPGMTHRSFPTLCITPPRFTRRQNPTAAPRGKNADVECGVKKAPLCKGSWHEVPEGLFSRLPVRFPFLVLTFCIRANWHKNCRERRTFGGKNAAIISLIQHSGVFSATELSVPFARPPETSGANVQFANEQDAKRGIFKGVSPP